MTDPRAFAETDRDLLLAQWQLIAAIPAPEGQEQRRAALIAELATSAGADRVGIDRSGNVVADLDGSGAAVLTVLATMDDLGSVAAHRRATDRLEVDGGRLVGPCVETTSSDASALALLRFFAARGERPWSMLRVAFVVGEETGLTGMHGLVADHGAGLGSVIDLMGGVGTVSWNAIGFAGVDVRFSAAPRHSLHGGRSEVSEAVARFVGALHADVPTIGADTVSVRRVNRLAAGSVFNHSPEHGTVGVDVRSTDPATLAALDTDTRRVAERVGADVGVSVEFLAGQHSPAITLPGGREHRLVRALAEAVRFAGHEPVLRPWSSSNVNVAYAAGLEAVVHDGLHRGGGRGTLDEWADIPRVVAGVVADCRAVEILTGVTGVSAAS